MLRNPIYHQCRSNGYSEIGKPSRSLKHRQYLAGNVGTVGMLCTQEEEPYEEPARDTPYERIQQRPPARRQSSREEVNRKVTTLPHKYAATHKYHPDYQPDRQFLGPGNRSQENVSHKHIQSKDTGSRGHRAPDNPSLYSRNETIDWSELPFSWPANHLY